MNFPRILCLNIIRIFLSFLWSWKLQFVKTSFIFLLNKPKFLKIFKWIQGAFNVIRRPVSWNLRLEYNWKAFYVRDAKRDSIFFHIPVNIQKRKSCRFPISTFPSSNLTYFFAGEFSCLSVENVNLLWPSLLFETWNRKKIGKCLKWFQQVVYISVIDPKLSSINICSLRPCYNMQQTAWAEPAIRTSIPPTGLRVFVFLSRNGSSFRDFYFLEKRIELFLSLCRIMPWRKYNFSHDSFKGDVSKLILFGKLQVKS